VLSCSPESIYKSKAMEKVNGVQHMVCLSFIDEKSEKFKAENRCRQCVNNAIKFAIIYANLFLCFQVLTACWMIVFYILHK
jgi:hypothetical protein